MKFIYRQKNVVLIFLGFVFLAISSSLTAQNDPVNPYPQLLFPKFSRGIIVMKSGVKKSAMLNYNSVDQEMLFNQNGVYLVLDRPFEIDTVYLQNRKFVYVDKAFYELIVESPASLFYIQHKSKYSQEGTPTAYGLTSQTNASLKVTSVEGGTQVRNLNVPDNVIVTAADVYWVKINNQMYKFTNEKQLFKIFPGKQNDLKTFIKSSKIDIKSREDLIKLGNYCNSLNK